MIGLPSETEEDIEGIIRLVNKVEQIGKEVIGRRIDLNISISTFVPKTHTPFQWEAQEEKKNLLQKIKYLDNQLQRKNISFNYPDIDRSYLEAVFARGDRRLGKVLEKALDLGCKFDAWREHFDFKIWQRLFIECGLSMEFYANRIRENGEILPWDHISCVVTKEYLLKEREKAFQGKITPDCRFDSCTSCGAC